VKAEEVCFELDQLPHSSSSISLSRTCVRSCCKRRCALFRRDITVPDGTLSAAAMAFKDHLSIANRTKTSGNSVGSRFKADSNSCRRLCLDSSEGTTSSGTTWVSSSNRISYSSFRCLNPAVGSVTDNSQQPSPRIVSSECRKPFQNASIRFLDNGPVRPDRFRQSSGRGYRPRLNEAEKALRNAVPFAFRRNSGV
jgi:hypothetical protein